MPFDPSHVFIDAEKLSWFRPILVRWVQVCETYKERVKGDYCWHYNERAQTGFLAAATWLSGGVALEEWRTNKKGHTGEDRRGRGDLWVEYEKHQLHIEAKYARINRDGRKGSGMGKVNEMFDKARNDAAAIKYFPYERRIGVLFAAPTISGRKNDVDSEQKYSEWLQDLREMGCPAMASIFDKDIACDKAERRPLGIALLIGNARRSSTQPHRRPQS
jgi:hypothetical protein